MLDPVDDGASVGISVVGDVLDLGQHPHHDRHDTRKVRVFGAWNVADSSGFARTIGTWSLRDNLSLESSVGWFFGQGDDTISRFADRDFVTVSLKTYF